MVSTAVRVLLALVAVAVAAAVLCLSIVKHSFSANTLWQLQKQLRESEGTSSIDRVQDVALAKDSGVFHGEWPLGQPYAPWAYALGSAALSGAVGDAVRQVLENALEAFDVGQMPENEWRRSLGDVDGRRMATVVLAAAALLGVALKSWLNLIGHMAGNLLAKVGASFLVLMPCICLVNNADKVETFFMLRSDDGCDQPALLLPSARQKKEGLKQNHPASKMECASNVTWVILAPLLLLYLFWRVPVGRQHEAAVWCAAVWSPQLVHTFMLIGSNAVDRALAKTTAGGDGGELGLGPAKDDAGPLGVLQTATANSYADLLHCITKEDSNEMPPLSCRNSSWQDDAQEPHQEANDIEKARSALLQSFIQGSGMVSDAAAAEGRTLGGPRAAGVDVSAWDDDIGDSASAPAGLQPVAPEELLQWIGANAPWVVGKAVLQQGEVAVPTSEVKAV